MTFWGWLALGAGVLVVLIIVIPACMLSSELSQRRERLEAGAAAQKEEHDQAL